MDGMEGDGNNDDQKQPNADDRGEKGVEDDDEEDNDPLRGHSDFVRRLVEFHCNTRRIIKRRIKRWTCYIRIHATRIYTIQTPYKHVYCAGICVRRYVSVRQPTALPAASTTVLFFRYRLW